MAKDELKLEDLLVKGKTQDDSAINNIAIIGAGIMGQGIAQTIASAGLDVIVIEKDQNNLARSQSMLSGSIDRDIKRW